MVLEGNKDEAEKCFNYAEKFLKEGNVEKALRFANKSNKLFPSEPCDKFIETLNNMSTNRAGGDTSKASENVRQRKPKSPPQSGHNSDAEPDYTKEQVLACKKIKKCKDYYEILGVTKEASESEMKKAYRKLALQFHPDKNKAPGSGEAFKAVGNAFAILNEPEKRKQYDLYGPEDSQSSAGRGNRQGDYTRGYESDVTADELFNMFFGGGGGGSMYYRRDGRWERNTRGQGYAQTRTTHHHETSHSEQSTLSVLFQLMPLLIILMLSLVSSFLSSDPVYSLSPSSKYGVQRTTHNLGVHFYVKSDFNTEYQGSLRRLEQKVEEDYVETLKHSCYKERNYKESMIWRAKTMGDSQLFRRAQDLRTPSCDSLHDLYS